MIKGRIHKTANDVVKNRGRDEIVHDPAEEKWNDSKITLNIGDPFTLLFDPVFTTIGGRYKCCLLFAGTLSRRHMEFYCINLGSTYTVPVPTSCGSSDSSNNDQNGGSGTVLSSRHEEAILSAFQRILRLIADITYTCVHASQNLDDKKSCGYFVTKIHPRPLALPLISLLNDMTSGMSVQLVSTKTENDVMEPHYRQRRKEGYTHQSQIRASSSSKFAGWNPKIGRKLNFEDL